MHMKILFALQPVDVGIGANTVALEIPPPLPIHIYKFVPHEPREIIATAENIFLLIQYA